MAKAEKSKGIGRAAFLNLLRQGKLHGAWLCEGIDGEQMRSAVEEVRRTLLPPGMEELNLTVLHAPETDAFVSACETIPFLADVRLVLVEDQPGLTGRPEADEALVEYAAQVPPTCLALFLLRGAADGRKKLPKALAKLGQIVTFAPMTELELREWTVRRFQELGCVCDPQAALELIHAVGTDSQLLSGEIEKLSAIALGRDEGGFVGVPLVRAAAAASPEYDVFRLTEEIVAGHETQAFAMLKRLKENGEEELGLLALLLREYRVLQHLKIMQYEKIPVQEAARRLGLSDYIYQKNARLAGQIRGAEVKAGVEVCLDTEYRVKSGQQRAEGLMASVLAELFARRRAAAAGRRGA